MRISKDSIVEIITVGSELLAPYSVETNSLYLTERLNDLGLRVSYKTTVGDDQDTLVRAIRESLSRASLIIATGGLGPTQDDRTREAFAEALHRNLHFSEEILQKIKERFGRRGRVMPEVNKKQAYIIEGAEKLENRNGTAPGLWLETAQNTIILLPGPPHELKLMCEESVWPRLKKTGSFFLFREKIKMADTTESEVETSILDIYDKFSDVRISTLAYPGQIEIHLSASSEKGMAEAQERVREVEKKILERLEEKIFSVSGEELEEVVGKLLRQKEKTLAVAESCTGGLLSNRITNIAGSSDYFLQGIVAYSNQAKIIELDVSPSLIEKHGAVSEEVARAMAGGIRRRALSSFGIGITGIAGPGGGSPEKPVGLVYIALDSEASTECSRNVFLGRRESIKFQSSQKALDMLRKNLLRASERKG